MNLVRAAQTVLSSTELCTLLFWQVLSKCFKIFLVCHARKGYCDSKAWKKGGGGAGFDMREANISCCRNDHCVLFEKQQVKCILQQKVSQVAEAGIHFVPEQHAKAGLSRTGKCQEGQKNYTIPSNTRKKFECENRLRRPEFAFSRVINKTSTHLWIASSFLLLGKQWYVLKS